MATKAPLQYAIQAHSEPGGGGWASCKETTIAFDASAGQSPTLPGPAELLVAAFAACVLKNVERFSAILPFRYRGASIQVTAEREESPPRISAIHYTLRVITDESPRRVELLHHNIEKFGTIFNTLAASCAVAGEIIAEPWDAS